MKMRPFQIEGPTTTFLSDGGESKGNERPSCSVERRERVLRALRVGPQSSTRYAGERPSPGTINSLFPSGY